MKKKSTIKRVLRYLGKYRIFLILSLGMALVTVAGQLYIPILQGNAIDNIIGRLRGGYEDNHHDSYNNGRCSFIPMDNEYMQ